MQAFLRGGREFFLVQEFIEESAGKDIRAFVVGGKVVASMKRQSLDDDFSLQTYTRAAKVRAVKY